MSLPRPLKISPSLPMLLSNKQEATKKQWLCSRVEPSPGHAEKDVIHSRDTWLRPHLSADASSDALEFFCSFVGDGNVLVDRTGGEDTLGLGTCSREAVPMGIVLTQY